MAITAVVVVLLLLLTALVALIAYQRRQQQPPEDVDPEQAMKAAAELHRIRRRFDTSWLKGQQRRSAAAVREEITEAFKEAGTDE